MILLLMLTVVLFFYLFLFLFLFLFFLEGGGGVYRVFITWPKVYTKTVSNIRQLQMHGF